MRNIDNDILQLKDFSAFYGSRIILDRVDASFKCGMSTALIGRNGTGKSTLLRALAGLNKNYTGTVSVNGSDIKDIKGDRMARLVSFVTTERTRVSNLMCRDVVALGRAPYTNWIGHMQPADMDIVEESLQRVGMSDYATRSMDTMSDGECQRIMIARALAQDTPVMMLDEPTSFLDLPNRYELARLLSRLAHEANKCIIYSTHELDIATRMCDSIALIDNQKLIHLPTEEMNREGHIRRLFNLDDILCP